MPLANPGQTELSYESDTIPAIEKSRDRLEGLLDGINNPLVQGPHLTSELAKLTEGNEVHQEAEDMDELRAMAARLKDTHNDLTSEVAKAGGGRPHLASKLKKETRMWEKYVEHGFTHTKTGDVLRTSIHFDDLESLYLAVVELYSRAKIVRVKDRFINPTSEGYRDMLFNISLVDPETGKTHITEIQFQLEDMYRAKKQEYPHYIQRRALRQELEYFKKEEPENIDKIRELEEEIAYLQSASQDIFTDAWRPYASKLLPDTKVA